MGYHGGYRVFFGTTDTYRLVAYQKFIGDGYIYKGLLTNNWEITDEEVIHFYNKRGGIERNFDYLKNNFNWGHLPFSHLSENTVFMVIEAICSIIYQYLVAKFSRKLPFLKSNVRLKRFIFLFITVSAEWIGKHTLRMFTDKDYRVLLE